jgi:hypothetical protein
MRKYFGSQCKSFACVRIAGMYCGRMKTASDIITFLGGRQAVADLVSVKLNAVRMAEAGGKLPAAWYNMLENHAGRPLPRDCFTFKGAA